MTKLSNKLYPAKYGYWAGNPRGNSPDYTRCCESVRGRDRWDIVGHQCRKPRGQGPDGAYCKQHDPAKVQARRDKSDRTYFDKMNKLQAQWHGPAFLAALREIEAGHNDPRSLAREVIAKYEESLR